MARKSPPQKCAPTDIDTDSDHNECAPAEIDADSDHNECAPTEIDSENDLDSEVILPFKQKRVQWNETTKVFKVPRALKPKFLHNPKRSRSWWRKMHEERRRVIAEVMNRMYPSQASDVVTSF